LKSGVPDIAHARTGIGAQVLYSLLGAPTRIIYAACDLTAKPVMRSQGSRSDHIMGRLPFQPRIVRSADSTRA
jgi:hypothetical protein